MDLSVVIPIFNEAESLEPLYQALKEALGRLHQSAEIIFVDDGSTDGSPLILDRLAAADSNVRVVHLRRNYGQTAALMAAIQFSTGDVVIPMDGDGQNDPADIPRLLAKLEEGYDVVSGWRKTREDKFSRRLASVAANWLVSAVMGVKLHDYGLDLLILYFLDRAFDRPIQFFGKFGLGFIFLSMATFAFAVALRLFADISLIQTPLPLLAATTGLSGILFLLLGVLAEVQVRTYYESQSKPPYKVRSTHNIPTAEPRKRAVSAKSW